MRLVIKFTDDAYVNIQAEIVDVDKVNGFLYAYAKDSIVGVFNLEYIKDAYLSEKGVMRMPEYIEREALLKDIPESVVFTVRGDKPSLEIRGANKVIDRIKSAPTADVVEVVRCKDCKRFLQMETSPSYDGKCLGYGYLVEANHFCSYGERKEGAEE